MGFLGKTKKATKQFFTCFILSLSLHSFFLAGSFILPPSPVMFPQKETLYIEARLIETPRSHEKEKLKVAGKSSGNFSFAKSANAKEGQRHAILRNVPPLVSGSAKHVVFLNEESLQRDVRELAENLAFGRNKNNAFVDSSVFTDSVYRRYVDDCREKLMRIGNASNKAKENGEVSMHITIGKNGEVVARYADSSVSLNLKNAALQVVDDASPFVSFPAGLPREIIKITVPIHFIAE